MASPVPPPPPAINLALAVVALSEAPLLLLDGDLAVVAASNSFCRTFQIDPAKAAGGPLTGLGAGQWNIPQLTALLKATASGIADIEDYEMNLAGEDRTGRTLLVTARKLDYAGEDEVRLLLTVADVTQERAAIKVKAGLMQDKDVLLQELHHRVANSLQIIASVLLQNARKVQSPESRIHLVDAHQRVMSVAALQQQLAASTVGDVALRAYFTALCQSIGASMIRDPDQLSLTVKTDESITSPDTSVSLGLIVTELVINALKHAFPDNRHGKIEVRYHSRGPNWTLSVSDDGIGMPGEPNNAKAGLGTSIIEALAKQLSARITVTNAKPGTKITVIHTHVPVLVGQSAPEAARAI